MPLYEIKYFFISDNLNKMSDQMASQAMVPSGPCPFNRKQRRWIEKLLGILPDNKPLVVILYKNKYKYIF